MSSNTDHNMVSSLEIRSSIQKARVSELVKERTIDRLMSAEGGAAVETAVDLHNKALRLVLGQKLVAGICLADVSLEDVSALVQTALAEQYDVDFMRIAWECHMQTDLLHASQQQFKDPPRRTLMQESWPVPNTAGGVPVVVPAAAVEPQSTAKTLFAEQPAAAGVTTGVDLP